MTQPNTLPYKEYIRIANYGLDWSHQLNYWLVLNDLTFDVFKQRIVDRYKELGGVEDCKDDYNLLLNTNTVEGISKDDAFHIFHLYLYLN
jgi:hypothetical protein